MKDIDRFCPLPEAEKPWVPSLHERQVAAGLYDRNNALLRVKWINALTKIVDRRTPRNKSGSPLTSNVDVALATPEEHEEALKAIHPKQEP